MNYLHIVPVPVCTITFLVHLRNIHIDNYAIINLQNITLNNMDSVTLFPFDIERDEQGCHWRNSGSFFQSELLIRKTSLHFWLNQFTLIKYGKRFL